MQSTAISQELRAHNYKSDDCGKVANVKCFLQSRNKTFNTDDKLKMCLSVLKLE